MKKGEGRFSGTCMQPNPIPLPFPLSYIPWSCALKIAGTELMRPIGEVETSAQSSTVQVK